MYTDHRYLNGKGRNFWYLCRAQIYVLILCFIPQHCWAGNRADLLHMVPVFAARAFGCWQSVLLITFVFPKLPFKGMLRTALTLFEIIMLIRCYGLLFTMIPQQISGFIHAVAFVVEHGDGDARSIAIASQHALMAVAIYRIYFTNRAPC